MKRVVPVSALLLLAAQDWHDPVPEDVGEAVFQRGPFGEGERAGRDLPRDPAGAPPEDRAASFPVPAHCTSPLSFSQRAMPWMLRSRHMP